MIDAVVPLGTAGTLGMLLDGVITAPRSGRPRPVYCALRVYLMDLKDELTQRGFSADWRTGAPYSLHDCHRENRARANQCISPSSSDRGCPAVCRRFSKVSQRMERYDDDNH